MSELVRLETGEAELDAPLLGRLLHGEAQALLQSDLLVEGLPVAPENGLAPALVRKRLQAFAVMMLVDIAILLGSFLLVSYLYLGMYLGQLMTDAAILPAYLMLPIYLTIAMYNGSYSGDALTDWHQSARRMASALLIAAVLFNFITFFAKLSEDFSRMAFALSLGSSMVLMIFLRRQIVRIVRRYLGATAINRLLILAGGPEVSLPDLYKIDAKAVGLRPRHDDPQSLHRLAKYLRNMDEVIVSCPEDERTAWSQVLKGAGVHAEVISVFARDIGALGIRNYGKAQFSTLVISSGTLRIRDRVLKRGFDIAASLSALVLLSPLMLVVALAIVIEDGSPVFFRQLRVGRGNHFFAILKFRSMRVAKADADGARSAAKDDDRITHVGRFIRRTSIDELPQLINVLRGDMSIVGPRPHALGSRAGDKLFWQIDRRYWLRHTLRPGITGLAQVRGYRGATDSEDDLSNRLQSDLEYLNDWSVLRDVGIIASTLGVLVHDRAF